MSRVRFAEIDLVFIMQESEGLKSVIYFVCGNLLMPRSYPAQFKTGFNPPPPPNATLYRSECTLGAICTNPCRYEVQPRSMSKVSNMASR